MTATAVTGRAAATATAATEIPAIAIPATATAAPVRRVDKRRRRGRSCPRGARGCPLTCTGICGARPEPASLTR
jgi:hypothetical protein